jgi:Nitroreductase family
MTTMRTRRTVRDISDRPVPFELVRNAVATAATAPGGANLQPWRFVVVSDPERKYRLRAGPSRRSGRLWSCRSAMRPRAPPCRISTARTSTRCSSWRAEPEVVSGS